MSPKSGDISFPGLSHSFATSSSLDVLLSRPPKGQSLASVLTKASPGPLHTKQRIAPGQVRIENKKNSESVQICSITFPALKCEFFYIGKVNKRCQHHLCTM